MTQLHQAEHVGVATADAVMTIILRRGEKLNAISPSMRKTLQKAIKRFGDDESLRVLVIGAEGRFFSSGMDISAMKTQPESGVALRNTYRELHEIFDRIESIEKPTVAAVQGPCLGGALEMVLSCDFRLASRDAYFALPEIAIGVLPGSGGTSRLTQLVGKGWARWMIMANQRVAADHAEQIGLVQAVYSADEFAIRVDEFVRTLAALPREAMGLAKLAIELTDELGRDAARNVERVANTLLMTGREHQEAIAAFRNRKSNK